MAVAFDTSGTSGQVTGSPSSVSKSITIGANSNRCLSACVYGDFNATFSTPTWNTSENFTFQDSVNISGIGKIAVYSLVAPTTGTHTGACSVSSTTEAGISLLSHHGVDQTTPFSGVGHTNGSSTDATHSIALSDASSWLAGFCLSQRSLTASTGIATLRDTIFSQCITSDSNAANGSTTGTGHMTLSSSNVWEIILWGLNPVQAAATNHHFFFFGIGT